MRRNILEFPGEFPGEFTRDGNGVVVSDNKCYMTYFSHITYGVCLIPVRSDLCAPLYANYRDSSIDVKIMRLFPFINMY